MLDIEKIYDDQDKVEKLIQHRCNIKDIAALLDVDIERKLLQKQADELRNKRNVFSKDIGIKKSIGDNKAAEALLSEVEDLKKELALFESKQKACEDKMLELLLRMPNIPMDDVPQGADDKTNQVLFSIGHPREFDFKVLSHDEILSNLKMWDPERAVKVSGRGFPLLCGDGAQLERALINFMLDHNTAYGIKEMWVPFAVLTSSLEGTGQLPKFQEDQFQIANSDLYLNPTAEVALTNVYREEILDELELPVRMTSYAPSFRREAGSYGKDTKGLIRVHQFNKVELVTLCRPEDSESEHEKMLKISQSILDKLELPYRIVLLSHGDMGFSAAKTYDIEVWLPSISGYREIASVSNCVDFQARRAHIKYRSNTTKKTHFVHTLNGSALAVGRTLVAILENYQQKDGSVAIPEALRPYFMKDKISN